MSGLCPLANAQARNVSPFLTIFTLSLVTLWFDIYKGILFSCLNLRQLNLIMQVKKDSESKVSLNFAIRLKAILEKKKISQKKLAKAIGVSAPAVQFWVKGKNGPADNVKLEIAKFLGVSYSWLYSGEAENRLPLFLNEETGIYDPRAPLKINPAYQFQQPSASIEKIDDFMRPWMAAASRNADIASHVLVQLKLNLPHNQIEVIENDPNDD